MQRVFIAHECYVGLRRLPIGERKGYFSALKTFFEEGSQSPTALKACETGDANTYQLDLSSETIALLRKFPDAMAEDEKNAFCWVLLSVGNQKTVNEMGKSIRFFWDGETTGLIRVLEDSGELNGPLMKRFHASELKNWGVPDSLIEKIQDAGDLETLQNFEGDLAPRTFYQIMDLAEKYQDFFEEEDLKILDSKLPSKEIQDLEEEIGQSLDDIFHSDRFCLIESENHLKNILENDMPIWGLFPLPDQRKWVTRNFKGPVLIRGVAGSGKSSLALMRAHYLAQEILEDNQDWILVITPYRTDPYFQEEINSLNGENSDRIEIKNIYDWAKDYLKDKITKFELNSSQALETLREAIDSCRPGMPNITPAHLDFNFVREEIAVMIKGRSLHSQPDYLALPRKEFGTPLNNEERRHLWRIYLKYQNFLSSRSIMDTEDLLVEAYKHLLKTPPEKKYASVIIDDTQDLPPIAVKMFQQITQNKPNGLLLLSDVSQKFMRTGDHMDSMGITLSTRPPLLRTNLRSTREISNVALEVLQTPIENLVGDAPSRAVHPEVTKSGLKPTIQFHESEEDEIIWVLELINELTSDPYHYNLGDIAIIGRSNRFLTLLEVNLNQSQIPCHNFKKSGLDKGNDKVKICSYADCKGMEFPIVILTEVVDGVIPTLPTGIDTDEMNLHLSREERLLYFGMNRAKESLYISGAGETPCRFLASHFVENSESENSENLTETGE